MDDEGQNHGKVEGLRSTRVPNEVEMDAYDRMSPALRRCLQNCFVKWSAYEVCEKERVFGTQATIEWVEDWDNRARRGQL